MKPTILYEASVKVPGRSGTIVIRALAKSKQHAKQLMIRDLQDRARRKAYKSEDEEKIQPLYLDEADIRELA